MSAGVNPSVGSTMASGSIAEAWNRSEHVVQQCETRLGVWRADGNHEVKSAGTHDGGIKGGDRVCGAHQEPARRLAHPHHRLQQFVHHGLGLGSGGA